MPDSLGETATHTKPQPPNGGDSLSVSVDGVSSEEVARDTGLNGHALADNGENRPRRSGTPSSTEAAQGATNLHEEERFDIPREVYAASDNVANGSLSETDKEKELNTAEREDGIELGDNVDKVVDLARDAGDDDDDDDDKEDNTVVVETTRVGGTKGDDNHKTVAILQNREDKTEPVKSVSEETHSLEDDKTHEEGGGVDTPWGGNNSVATTDDGSTHYNQYDDIDEDELLDKLLDETAPSEMFEDDHQKLLQKLMRSRDDDQVRAARHPPVQWDGEIHPCDSLRSLSLSVFHRIPCRYSSCACLEYHASTDL